MFYVLHTIHVLNNQYTIQQMLSTAWYFTLCTGYLEDIVLDHLESRRMFLYIFHIYKNNLITGICGGLFLHILMYKIRVL